LRSSIQGCYGLPMPLADLLERVGVPELEGTFLAILPDTARRALLATSVLLEVRARTLIFGSTDQARAGFVLDGLARTYLSDHSGRQLTVRYVRAGDIVGNVSGADAERVPLSVSAVTGCVLIEIDVATLLHLVNTDPRVGSALVNEVTSRLQDSYAALGANSLGSMRERVAWHLLDQAIHGPSDGRLTVALTQQQLADSVGSVREVVARVLRELRDAGLVATTNHQIEIVDPVRLAAIAGRQRS